VAEPQFTAAEELKADISHHESMWGLYEEFSNGLDELAKEDWISFRCSLSAILLSFSFRERFFKSLLFCSHECEI